MPLQNASIPNAPSATSCDAYARGHGRFKNRSSPVTAADEVPPRTYGNSNGYEKLSILWLDLASLYQ